MACSANLFLGVLGTLLFLATGCQVYPPKHKGCRSAPACTNAGQCKHEVKTCYEDLETSCQGCLKGAPGCPSGWVNQAHKGTKGTQCWLSCCLRYCRKQHSRDCVKSGCCNKFTCPKGYNKKPKANSVIGDASKDKCCQIKTGQCRDYSCPAGYKLKKNAASIQGEGNDGQCCEACLVSNVKGMWMYKKDVNEGDTYEVTEGIEQVTGFERTNEWSKSLEKTISAGFNFCAGIGTDHANIEACLEASVAVTEHQGRAQSKTYNTAFHKTSEITVSIPSPRNGLAFWQYSFDVMDECNKNVDVAVLQYAYTSSKTTPPRCLPGFCDTSNDAYTRCCTCKAAPSGQVVEIPGAQQCPKAQCDGSQNVQVNLGGSVMVAPGKDIEAGLQTTVPCKSVNPDYKVGDIIVRCTADNAVWVPDASGCSRAAPLPSTPSPSSNPSLTSPPRSTLKQCLCGSGTPASGALCPQTGTTSCVSCHPGYKLENSDCVKKTTTQAPGSKFSAGGLMTVFVVAFVAVAICFLICASIYCSRRFALHSSKVQPVQVKVEPPEQLPTVLGPTAQTIKVSGS